MSDQLVAVRSHVSRRGVWGWIFFDWAAQPFFTVIVTFIFGPYFISRMADTPEAGQVAWGYGFAAAGFVIAILSPVLGAIADKTGSRKPWIGFFAVLKIAGLLALWFAVPGASLFWVLLAFSIAMVSAEFSIVFNDSMMPRLVAAREIGKVSNLAWGLGYLGGVLVLIFVVVFLAASPETGKTLIGLPPLFGLDPASGEDARITGPIAALWYFVFIMPMFLFTPDQARGEPLRQAVRSGLAELRSTLGEVRKRPGIARFLAARLVYQDGLNAIVALGAGYAASLFHWSINEIGLFGMITNVSAILSCLVAARLDARIGSKAIVMGSLVLLLVASFGIVSTKADSLLLGLVPVDHAETKGLFSTVSEQVFLVYGLMIGAALGPVQASARSWFARSIKPEESGRYFGIYALAGRATSFLGPFLVATITALSQSAALGMSVLLLFFAVGLYLAAITPYPADKPLSSGPL
ncbi:MULTISPECIES: MFS transporter [Brucella/Ochrobactrum group]|uniref:MFS transporter n=1 Tax=Brucella pseudintermedia TaxID=370111 RepID=A0ABY5U7T9_9HYPH|nr:MULTISPECIES: MFS transporter [Brucella/Ochrobactrum group]KAB2679206.1 MFS transporter [Brucella pseudintermedia]NKE77760.1 MFS transporter [Ochrobactrum sp. MC-1LL]TWG95194.1 UMF1 family MFS transporter [Ochrobactrum sp. J50]UWL59405.1 MFS transporter [Brucella pseudintermedia]WPM79825.1 MFS transporter [Brucella pseudintermedia]